MAAGELRPDSLREVGFVHLSAVHQVHLPANRWYSGRNDLLLLHLDPDRLDGEIRWEPGVPGDPAAMTFPHLYAAVPASAVISVTEYRPGPDGRFEPVTDRRPAAPR